MTIDYIKLSPTGNITLLVTSPVPRDRQAAVAARLLEAVGGEQVGYVEPAADPRAAARLQMMGGEFCGNASMSLGAVLCREAGLAPGAVSEPVIEVSGCEAPVPCRIRREAEGWIGTVQMPLPTRLGLREVPVDGGSMAVPAVEMPGITHLLLPASVGLDEAQLRRRLPEWNRQIAADALGALLWDEAASAIDPLVYVPSAGTLVREHGCGSGSAAVGGWLAVRDGRDREVGIRQPGGTITARARLDASGALSALTITGKVALLEEGRVEIEE